MRLCQYKNILGEPRKGFHSIRIFDFAILDIIGTIIIALVLSYATNIKFTKLFIILLLLGIFLHWLFCVETKSAILLGLV